MSLNETSTDARDHLLINGEWVLATGGAPISVISPSTEEVIGHAPDASAADVDAAVRSARASFSRGSWRRLGIDERADILRRAVDLLEGSVEEVADLVTAQMGLPTSISRKKTPGGVWAARYIIDLALELPKEEIRQTMFGPVALLKEPVGVVAAIAPWNSPFNMAISKIIPALMAGNSVVYKPSPQTPLDAYRIAEALVEAGLPAGAFNLVTGGVETGRALAEHPDVDKVSFTGSTRAGREIAQSAGSRFARLQLELGGKSAAIILDDADPEVVKAGLIAGTFANTGQVCSSYTRILVPASSRQKWADVVVDAARSFVIGDAFDPATTMGPLVSAVQRDRVMDYIALGQAEGAVLATGGGVPEGLDRGYFVEPTVFVKADNSMRLAREEIFGPVATVIHYDDLDDAIEIANDSPYGLHGAVFTTDDHSALAVARGVRTGTFSVNSYIHNVQAPFGGVKDSGVGKEMGREGVEAFYEVKTVNLSSLDPNSLTS
ncbi:MAG TPA: aldehyde dehydrogenase [Pseudolysinimonas sp.]|nr:aldehyde dehydrogenase [Pseudolysinimonas sp.]